MANAIAIDSFLDRHPCSGRNLTWQYIHTNGTLPAPYSACPHVSEILKSHCCSKGVCNPGYYDREFDKYGAYDWDGLGDPRPEGDANGEGTRGKRGKGRMRIHCMGMEMAWGVRQTHWPPLGLDGLPMRNYSSKEWMRPVLGKGKRGLGWDGERLDGVVVWKPARASLRRVSMEQYLPPAHEELAIWPFVRSLGICAIFLFLIVKFMRTRRRVMRDRERRSRDDESGTEHSLDDDEGALNAMEEENPSEEG